MDVNREMDRRLFRDCIPDGLYFLCLTLIMVFPSLRMNCFGSTGAECCSASEAMVLSRRGYFCIISFGDASDECAPRSSFVLEGVFSTKERRAGSVLLRLEDFFRFTLIRRG